MDLKNFKRNIFLILIIIINQYSVIQGLALRNDLDSSTIQRNGRQLPKETTNLAGPATTEQPLTSEFEVSGNNTPDTITSESLKSEFLRKPYGLEGLIEKIHNQHINKLEHIKNVLTKPTTLIPVVTTPSVHAVTATPINPTTEPSLTVIKIIKFPCGPFLKCILKQIDIPTASPTPATTLAPPITETTTPAAITTTTRRFPGNTTTRRNSNIQNYGITTDEPSFSVAEAA